MTTAADTQSLLAKARPRNYGESPCFVVDRQYRRRGIAGVALEAALEAIRSKGGGLVEAYPVARWRAGTFGNSSTYGTVSMFQKRGFKVVAPFGSANVLMRRTI